MLLSSREVAHVKLSKAIRALHSNCFGSFGEYRSKICLIGQVLAHSTKIGALGLAKHADPSLSEIMRESYISSPLVLSP